MNLNLTGKSAIVCGSTQGLGKASAVELALLGASVVLMARNEQSLRKTQSELDTGKGQKHGFIVADFSDVKQVGERVNEFVKKNPPVHILVNNTGGPPGGPIVDAALKEFVDAFSAHLLCSHILAQAVIPGMKAERFGRIISIISTSVKQPIAGLGVSNTIRGAVASWAKTLAGELGPFGITVNNVLPGMTKTGRLDALIKSKSDKSGKTIEQITNEMIAEIPAGRFAMPEEFGATVAFLATPAASYINGINLPVDGGRTLSL
ncbi:MAG: SDR family oxidoreductase [Bacteroidetes bacterium]|nr:SDR family oxidoreductase [Bacteroidota bacterium]MCW5896863.1 SDR family oxidoreductase [Bacteroidota bacterium]